MFGGRRSVKRQSPERIRQAKITETLSKLGFKISDVAEHRDRIFRNLSNWDMFMCAIIVFPLEILSRNECAIVPEGGPYRVSSRAGVEANEISYLGNSFFLPLFTLHKEKHREHIRNADTSAFDPIGRVPMTEDLMAKSSLLDRSAHSVVVDSIGFLLPLDEPGILVDDHGQRVTTFMLGLKLEERQAIEQARKIWLRRRLRDSKRHFLNSFGNTRVLDNPSWLTSLWEASITKQTDPLLNQLDRIRLKVFLLHQATPLTEEEQNHINGPTYITERYLDSLWRKRDEREVHNFIKYSSPNILMPRSVGKEIREAQREPFYIEEEFNDFENWSPAWVNTNYPLVLLLVFLFFSAVGAGNPLLAGESIKELLRITNAMNWMAHLERIFYINNMLAIALAAHYLSLGGGSLLIVAVGPKIVATGGFLLASVGWHLLSVVRAPPFYLAALCLIGIGSGGVSCCVQSIANVFAAGRYELDILLMISIAQGLAPILPVLLNILCRLSMRCRVIFDRCSLLFLLLSIAAFFSFPRLVPQPRRRPLFRCAFNERIKSLIDRDVPIRWPAFMWGEKTRSRVFCKTYDDMIGHRNPRLPDVAEVNSPEDTQKTNYPTFFNSRSPSCIHKGSHNPVLWRKGRIRGTEALLWYDRESFLLARPRQQSARDGRVTEHVLKHHEPNEGSESEAVPLLLSDGKILPSPTRRSPRWTGPLLRPLDLYSPELDVTFPPWVDDIVFEPLPKSDQQPEVASLCPPGPLLVDEETPLSYDPIPLPGLNDDYDYYPLELERQDSSSDAKLYRPLPVLGSRPWKHKETFLCVPENGVNNYMRMTNGRISLQSLTRPDEERPTKGSTLGQILTNSGRAFSRRRQDRGGTAYESFRCAGQRDIVERCRGSVSKKGWSALKDKLAPASPKARWKSRPSAVLRREFSSGFASSAILTETSSNNGFDTMRENTAREHDPVVPSVDARLDRLEGHPFSARSSSRRVFSGDPGSAAGSQYRNPPLWDLPWHAAAVQPQCVLILITLTALQFICLERFVNGFSIINSIAQHVQVAKYYQYLFAIAWLSIAISCWHPSYLYYPLFCHGVVFGIIAGFLHDVCFEWRQIVALLVVIDILAIGGSVFAIVPVIWVQLLSMTCTALMYTLMNGFGLLSFQYLFGSKNADRLIPLSMVARAMAFMVALYTHTSEKRRLHFSVVIQVLTLIPIVMLYLLDPSTFIGSSISFKTINRNLPVLQRPVRFITIVVPVLVICNPSEWICFGP